MGRGCLALWDRLGAGRGVFRGTQSRGIPTQAAGTHRKWPSERAGALPSPPVVRQPRDVSVSPQVPKERRGEPEPRLGVQGAGVGVGVEGEGNCMARGPCGLEVRPPGQPQTRGGRAQHGQPAGGSINTRDTLRPASDTLCLRPETMYLGQGGAGEGQRLRQEMNSTWGSPPPRSRGEPGHPPRGPSESPSPRRRR